MRIVDILNVKLKGIEYTFVLFSQLLLLSKNTIVLLDRTVKDLRMGANISEFWCWVLSAAKIKVPLSTLIGQTGKNAMYRSTAITDDLKCHDESKRVRTLHI